MIFIDPPRWPAHGRLWSHLISDTSYLELQSFADKVGLPRKGFEGDHYDVPQERYAAAVAAGAHPVEGLELVRRLRESGLRFPKRKGERPLATYRDVLRPETRPHTLHVVGSPLPTPDAETAATAVFVTDAAGSVLLVHSVVRDLWGAPAGGREPGEGVADCGVREVFEETGLVVAATDLVRVGYERVTFAESADGYGRWTGRRSYVAVLAVAVPGVRPPVAPRETDVDAVEWLTPAQAQARCGELFWWPLLTYRWERLSR